MKSFTVFLCTLAATALAQTTRPFKVIVETPELPMFAPIYLAADGSVTSSEADGAAVRIVDGELFVAGSTVPVGAGTNTWETRLLPLQGLDSINPRWSIDEENHLQWVNGRFPYGAARFVYGEGREDFPRPAVYAELGPAPEGEDHSGELTTPANLLVYVPPNW
ncbi:hypothetical protein PVAG01_04930 [Phlyctema vagabunda]|uniref:DUF7908 domain-containing protein n=1 Tax=Phlyctema vagabunda TaxID=108571 RepID=A0ABR4PIN4_9HELO